MNVCKIKILSKYKREPARQFMKLNQGFGQVKRRNELKS